MDLRYIQVLLLQYRKPPSAGYTWCVPRISLKLPSPLDLLRKTYQAQIAKYRNESQHRTTNPRWC